ncbi:MAG: PilZ domain-containing protein [Sandaracinaceae bacterium]|nr:PilZ domain-containing protein [Sandaracinaceae bacterium]
MGDERRNAPREAAYIAAEITVGDGKPKLAVMQDASATGLRLLTHTRVEVGDPIDVALQVEAERRVEVSGEVARVQTLEPGGPWRYRLGVALDEPHPDLAELAHLIGEKQRDA